MSDAEVPGLLITMPHSHCAEKAPWALDRLAMAYREEPHVPVLHRMATRRHGGGSVPVFVRGGGDCLSPLEPAARRSVEALEARFDDTLGPHTRRWATFQVMARRQVLQPLMALGVARTESRLLYPTLPLVFRVIRKGLRITPKGARRSIEQAPDAMRKVVEHLRDTRAGRSALRLNALERRRPSARSERAAS